MIATYAFGMTKWFSPARASAGPDMNLARARKAGEPGGSGRSAVRQARVGRPQNITAPARIAFAAWG